MKLWLFIGIILFLSISIAQAIPLEMGISGTLMDKAGQPLFGKYNFVFSLYNVSEGGNAIAQSSGVLTLSDNGQYHTSIDISGISNIGDLWVGIKVNTDSEMLQRTKVISVPYALYCSNLENFTVSNFTNIYNTVQILNSTPTNLSAITYNVTAINQSLKITQDTLTNWINVSSYTSNGSGINSTLNIIVGTLAGWTNITATPSYTENGTAINISVQDLKSLVQNLNNTRLNITDFNTFTGSITSNASGINTTLSSVNITLTNLYFDFGKIVFNQSQTNYTLYTFMPLVVANISGLNVTINSLLSGQSALTFNISQINLSISSLQTGQGALTANLTNVNASLQITQSTLANWNNATSPSYTANGTAINSTVTNRTFGKIIGFTQYSYSGNVTNGSLYGYTAAHAICNAEKPNSHFCMEVEVLKTIQLGNTSITGTYWMQKGAPGYTANANDCAGFTNSTLTYLGAFWNWNANGDGGQGFLTNCGQTKQLMCCGN